MRCKSFSKSVQFEALRKSNSSSKMKIQLIILALFVVATLAHRQRDGDDENQVRRRGRWNRRNSDSKVYADAEEAAEIEETIPTEGDQVTEELAGKKRCGQGRRRGGQRGHRRHYQGSEDKNQADEKDMSEGETRPQFSHNPDWHQKHGVPMPDGNSEVGRRHHHRHHHHHHHKHTTTAAPPTTTQAPPSSTSEFDNE